MAQEKKKWFDVEIPLIKTRVKLIAYSIEELEGRTIKLDLTRILRGKSLEAIIKVKVKDSHAIGEITELNLLPFFIRRMMRTNISYVEDSLSLESLDSVIRMKPFMITRKKVIHAVRKALRNASKTYLQEYLKDKTSEEVFYDIINNKIQKSMSLKLKKIYPLALCEIRMTGIEKMKEGVKIERVRREPVAEEKEKSQIEEIEEELAKKKVEVEEIKEKTQAEEIEEKEKAEPVKDEKKKAKKKE